MKQKKNMLHFCILFNFVGSITSQKSEAESAMLASSESVAKSNEDIIIKYIELFENLANHIAKITRGEIILNDNLEILFGKLVHISQNLTESVKDVNNAYTFLDADGIDRVIANNLLTPQVDIRTNLLILMRRLFEITPTTAAVIPESIVDNLLDIFENEGNLALKAHALDILYLWLPKNPGIQVRVMKLKGLEPFYNQVSRLDISVVHTLLDLFNIILKEHLIAKNEKIQRTKADFDRFRLYQRVGLLERMSTRTVCNGLLDIFEVAWDFNNDDILITVFNMIENIKPFCINIYGGNVKAVNLFDALLKYVRYEEHIQFLLKNGINVTSLDTVIEEYINNIKVPTKRDEF